MHKRQLQTLLDRSGLNLSKLSEELGLHKTSASRWGDDVPRYAQWYAALMAVASPEQREEARRLVDQKSTATE